jgi:hypothetical protein
MVSARTAVAILVFILIAASFSFFLPSVKAAEDLQILSHTGYIDSSGYYNVVGEVENVGAQAVNSVVINVTFYDSNNVSIASRTDSTMLSIILDARKSPFDIQLLNTAQSAHVYNYTISFTYSPTISIPEKLEIPNSTSFTDDTGVLHVTGYIRNIGNAEALTVKLVVTYYDKAGNVKAAIFQYTDPENPSLAPGQTVAFDIPLQDTTRVPLVANYEITAESVQYAAVPEFPVWAYLLLIVIPIGFAMIVRRIKRRTTTKLLPSNHGSIRREELGSGCG